MSRIIYAVLSVFSAYWAHRLLNADWTFGKAQRLAKEAGMVKGAVASMQRNNEPMGKVAALFVRMRALGDKINEVLGNATRLAPWETVYTSAGEGTLVNQASNCIALATIATTEARRKDMLEQAMAWLEADEKSTIWPELNAGLKADVYMILDQGKHDPEHLGKAAACLEHGLSLDPGYWAYYRALYQLYTELKKPIQAEAARRNYNLYKPESEPKIEEAKNG